MTPQRAQELLDLKTKIGNCWVPTVTVGDIKTHMSDQEIDFVIKVWDTMPGDASFAMALYRIVDKPLIAHAQLHDNDD